MNLRTIILTIIITLTQAHSQALAHAQSQCTWNDTDFSLDEWNEIYAHPTVAIAVLENYKTLCPNAGSKVEEMIGYLRRSMVAHHDRAVVRSDAWSRRGLPWACPMTVAAEMDPWTVISQQEDYGFLTSDGQLMTGFEFGWAEDFGYGLALVNYDGEPCFLDHSGHPYQAAYAVEDIVEATEAVFLSAWLPFDKAAVPTTAPQVKMLIVDAERLPTLKLQAEMFPNLETLVIKSLKSYDVGSEKTPPVTVPIFPRLHRLVLARVQPLNLDRALAGMPLLRSIKFIRPHLERLPLEIGHLFDLEELSVENYGLGRLPGSFSELRRLKRLSLSGCGMEEFPTAILELDSLQVLDLSENPFQTVPDAISELKDLRVLSIRNCRIAKPTKALFVLPELEALDVSENSMHGLPEGLPAMPALRRLDLHNGFNGHFASEPALLPNLCFLNLSSNYEQLSPELLSHWKQVKVLDLSDAELETLPKALREMSGLDHLILSKNPCSDTPEKRQAILQQMAQWLPSCKVYFD